VLVQPENIRAALALFDLRNVLPSVCTILLATITIHVGWAGCPSCHPKHSIPKGRRWSGMQVWGRCVISTVYDHLCNIH
jgi:hypothetical protein